MPSVAGKADLAIVFDGVEAAFNRGLANTNRSRFGVDQDGNDVALETVAMVIGSSASAETYPMITSDLKMREWFGDRIVNALGLKKLYVPNRKFEATLGIPVDDVNDGASLGLSMAGFEELGEESKALWVDLLVDAMVANGNWADDAAFFGTTRTFSAGNTIVNKTTSALSTSTFATALIAMKSYLGYNGKPMKSTPTHLIVGPKLYETAHAIVKSSLIPDGANGNIENPNKGKVRVVECGNLIGAYDDYWFLIDASGARKPFVVQKREETGIVAKTALTDDNVFFQDEYVWGCKSRGEAALLLPQKAYAGIL